MNTYWGGSGWPPHQIRGSCEHLLGGFLGHCRLGHTSAKKAQHHSSEVDSSRRRGEQEGQRGVRGRRRGERGGGEGRAGRAERGEGEEGGREGGKWEGREKLRNYVQ